MKRLLNTFVLVITVVMIAIGLFSLGGMMTVLQSPNAKVDEASILQIDLEGVILDGTRILEDIREYADNDQIKGVLVRINSPGGVVGPSQEIYQELKRIREELQKPVVVSCNAVTASGAYYVAVAADQIITNPGTLMGSIGVIMGFMNLEKLYSWAKIEHYSIKTGAFKDSGAPHRPMREDEKEYFQSLINEVHQQFKSAVSKSRKLAEDVVEKYSDGRVFSGAKAVKLGFADQLGGYVDALRVVGELAGLGADPKVFIPSKKRGSVFMELFEQAQTDISVKSVVEQFVYPELRGKPLYIMPGAAGL